MTIFDDLGMIAPVLRALVLTAGAIVWTLLLARLVGLRAFSKATAFDFAATIATGSLIAQAGTRSDWSAYVQSMAAIAAIFFVQYLLARGRQYSRRFAQFVDNQPVLLMENGEFLDAAMRTTRITHSTLLEKLRAANVRGLADVRAVVLEKTGDLTVMTTAHFDAELLQGVRRIH